MKSYFNITMEPCEECCVFCFQNVPVASFTYDRVDLKGEPVVNRFCFDKDTILSFDLGQVMRTALYQSHGGIQLHSATNYKEFLSI